MAEHILKRYVVVGLAQGPGETGTRGGERGKAELRKQARTAGIPGVGNHEATGLVQLAKHATAIVSAR
jgi:hypothetical protein